MKNTSFLIASSLLAALFHFSMPNIAKGQSSLDVTLEGDGVVSAPTESIASLVMHNLADRPISGSLTYQLQRNSMFDIPAQPDPIFGFDHGVKGKSQVVVDGTALGNALMVGSSPYVSFRSNWGKHKDAVVTVKLDQKRRIKKLRWRSGDANWIWQVDVSARVNGEDFRPIAQLQNFDLHRKWGTNDFPINNEFDASELRFRFHRNGEFMNVVDLPSEIQIYDGIQNDTIVKPTVGPEMFRGELNFNIPASGKQDLSIAAPAKIPAGSYLLTWQVDGEIAQWAPLFVKPGPPPIKSTVRHLGINSSSVDLIPLMAECGFGSVRFENGKWQMSSDARGRYDFSGGVAPWHVNQDAIYRRYAKADMQVFPYVFQTPEWATSAPESVQKNRAGYPPKNRSDYREAIFQFVARFGSKHHPADVLKTKDQQSGLDLINAIELWNEPNLVGPSWAPFVGSIEEYFLLMREGVEGARAADPDLLVTSCGWAGVAAETVQQMSTYRYLDGKTPLDLVDVVNVHMYSGRQEPEFAREDPNARHGIADENFPTLMQQVDELIRWRDELKPTAQIWVTETGNDVGGPIGLSERKQAAKLPRTILLLLARGVDKVFLYRESGSKASQHAGAGLVRDEGTLRPSWFTVATATRQLSGVTGKARRLPHPNPNVWLYQWSTATKTLTVAWALGEPVTIDLRELINLDQSRVIDAFGHPMKVERDIQLSEFPIYVTRPVN
ncbi:glycoside hydrolase family protein [Roseiconus lacunae]|uniref:hypothetical protein n=1 Tax=Roseiconus lacunae TaxID=2605694 RepID=UPI001E30F788|nr:hypothetical protein [Roseiconus lacunae]